MAKKVEKWEDVEIKEHQRNTVTETIKDTDLLKDNDLFIIDDCTSLTAGQLKELAERAIAKYGEHVTMHVSLEWDYYDERRIECSWTYERQETDEELKKRIWKGIKSRRTKAENRKKQQEEKAIKDRMEYERLKALFENEEKES